MEFTAVARTVLGGEEDLFVGGLPSLGREMNCSTLHIRIVSSSFIGKLNEDGKLTSYSVVYFHGHEHVLKKNLRRRTRED
jgi:hypothetical protein